jgi:hypothetical protein
MPRREPNPPFDVTAFIRNGGVDAEIASVMRLTREYWLGRLGRILAGEVKVVGLDEATRKTLAREVTKLCRALKTSPGPKWRRRQTRDRVRRWRERKRGQQSAAPSEGMRSAEW